MKDSGSLLGPVLFNSSSWKGIVVKLRPQQTALLLRFRPPTQIRVKGKGEGGASVTAAGGKERRLTWLVGKSAHHCTSRDRSSERGLHAAKKKERERREKRKKWSLSAPQMLRFCSVASLWLHRWQGTGVMRVRLGDETLLMWNFCARGTV